MRLKISQHGNTKVASLDEDTVPKDASVAAPGSRFHQFEPLIASEAYSRLKDVSSSHSHGLFR